MKTAKQINDSQTGNIEPMVISKMKADEIVEKLKKPYTHPLTCKKCHRVINTQLCAVCENELQWLEKPNNGGWWWFVGKYHDSEGTKWCTKPVIFFNRIDRDDPKYNWLDSIDGGKFLIQCFEGKWLKITEPTLPQK